MALRVIVPPVWCEGQVLRLVSDGSQDWAERWDGRAWVRGGSPGDVAAGIACTGTELRNLGIPTTRE